MLGNLRITIHGIIASHEVHSALPIQYQLMGNRDDRRPEGQPDHQPDAPLPLKLHNLLAGGCLFPIFPDKFLLGYGQPQRTATPPPEHFSLYAPDFFLEDPYPWWSFPNHQLVTQQAAISLLAQLTEPPSVPPSVPQSVPPSVQAEKNHSARTRLSGQYISSANTQDVKDGFISPPPLFKQNFSTIKSLIAQGQIQKAVHTTFVPIGLATTCTSGQASAAPTARDWLQALPQLLALTLHNAGPSRHPYALWSSLEGLVGATPELLFELDAPSRKLRTMALAGTRKAVLEERSPLLTDPKERHEHQLVVDFLHQQLSQLKDVGPVTCSETYVAQTGELCHLCADLEISHLTSPQAWEERVTFIKRLVDLLHPTPALGTAPHSEAFPLLRSLDNGQPRGRFGAPFGLLTPEGSFRVLVAIRNLQWISLGGSPGSLAPALTHRGHHREQEVHTLSHGAQIHGTQIHGTQSPDTPSHGIKSHGMKSHGTSVKPSSPNIEGHAHVGHVELGANLHNGNAHAFIGVGCGIVADSTLENEWREVMLKLQSICKLFTG